MKHGLDSDFNQQINRHMIEAGASKSIGISDRFRKAIHAFEGFGQSVRDQNIDYQQASK